MPRLVLRPLLIVAVLALLFGGSGVLDMLPAGVSALSAVAAGVALTSLTAGALAAETVVIGAAAAVGYTVLSPYAPMGAGAVLTACAFAPHAGRAVRRADAALVMALAVVAGALAAELVASYEQAELVLRAVSIGVAALLASVPLIVSVDDPTAFALRRAAREVTGASRWTLLRGVVLRRRMLPMLEDLRWREARPAHDAWRALVRLARARVRSATAPAVDRRIRDQVDALARVVRALERRETLADVLQSSTRGDLDAHGDGVEAEAEALATVTATEPTPETDGPGATEGPGATDETEGSRATEDTGETGGTGHTGDPGPAADTGHGGDTDPSGLTDRSTASAAKEA